MIDQNSSLNGLPVIVGSSFSGVLLSLKLSESGVEHVLIGGDPPNDDPRLGESLNECAAPELYGRFGLDYPECFFTKSHISLLNGDFSTQVQLANPNRCPRVTSRYSDHLDRWPISRWTMLKGSFTGRTLMHVDRSKLDPIVYHRAVAHSQCRLIKSLVDRIEVEGDRVTAIQLEDGTTIDAPRYVFDTTGFRNVVGQAFDVGTTPISNTQRVIWTHQHASDVNAVPERWWRRGTNLLKLDEKVDGFDGISWLIPLGEYVSIGVSVDRDRFPAEKFDKETIVRMLNEAYARRGIDSPTLFPEQQRAIMELSHRYYLRDRAYGANWLLVGASYLSVWFPSSAGLWTSVAACHLVPHIFDRPQELGARYEAYLKPLTVFHELLEKMIHGDPFQSNREVKHFWTRWLSDVPTRLSYYLQLFDLARPIKRQRLDLIGKWGSLCKTFPLFTQLMWTQWCLRTARQPDLSRQAGEFRGYNHPTLFRLSNFVRNTLRFFNPFDRKLATNYFAKPEMAASNSNAPNTTPSGEGVTPTEGGDGRNLTAAEMSESEK